MKVRCKEGFLVERYDDDGFTIPGKYTTIRKGSVWDVDESNSRIIGGEVRLEHKKYGWLELSKESFEENFERVDKP